MLRRGFDFDFNSVVSVCDAGHVRRSACRRNGADCRGTCCFEDCLDVGLQTAWQNQGHVGYFFPRGTKVKSIRQEWVQNLGAVRRHRRALEFGRIDGWELSRALGKWRAASQAQHDRPLAHGCRSQTRNILLSLIRKA
jgi:hypothetical protein